MGLRTPLYDTHVAAGARMVDFGGWDMPVHYGSQIEEHHAVRRDAGMFDVSHMCVIDLAGPRVRNFLRYLLANDVAKLKQPGKALYSCMLNDRGGVIDDLIVYYRDDTRFRAVVNAGTRDKDIAWIKQHARHYGVDAQPRTDLALIAVQGPRAAAKVAPLLGDMAPAALALKPFFSFHAEPYFISATGYTGEKGWEIVLPAEQAVEWWGKLRAAGVAQCGLGARDTLRLEAGMNLYGNDMDESVTPFESGLEWTVALDDARDFIGADALRAQKAAGIKRKLVGLLLEDRGVLRSHQKVVTSAGDGEITSGTYSPTLERSIALARIPAEHNDGHVQVDVRSKLLAARIVRYPFVRNGQACIQL